MNCLKSLSKVNGRIREGPLAQELKNTKERNKPKEKTKPPPRHKRSRRAQ
jgi:hypothetical protein